jgi:hypothetical protein
VVERQQCLAYWVRPTSKKGEEEVRLHVRRWERIRQDRIWTAAHGSYPPPAAAPRRVYARLRHERSIPLVEYVDLFRKLTDQFVMPECPEKRILGMLMEIHEQNHVGSPGIGLELMDTDHVGSGEIRDHLTRCQVVIGRAGRRYMDPHGLRGASRARWEQATCSLENSLVHLLVGARCRGPIPSARDLACLVQCRRIDALQRSAEPVGQRPSSITDEDRAASSHFRERRRAPRDQWDTGGHGLERWQAISLVLGWHDDSRRRRHELNQDWARDLTE